MAEYLSPGVYIEDNPNPPVIEAVSASTGGFMGVAQRGKVGVPVLITSWNAYIHNYALGMDSPFLVNSYLAYAVYGFFQNGGKRCYIMRVASDKAMAASLSPSDFVIKAKDEGAWGNNIKVTVTQNTAKTSNFDITVKLGTEVVEVFRNVSNTVGDDNYWVDAIEDSDYIVGANGTLALTEETALSKGADGVDDIEDTDYTTALPKFDPVDDMSLLCIPGQTSTTVTKALMDYCAGRKDIFAIVDAPEASGVAEILESRKTMSCTNGALFFPWIKVADPLSKIGRLKNCPPCGHTMGVYARVISERGVWKAPAGTEANIRGAVDVTKSITKGELDTLNMANIISIIPKTNYGIVIWGARSLHPDSSMKYVSDILLDIFIKKSVYKATQPFVFEPNDPQTWVKVRTTVQAFLDGLWRDGGLFGKTAKEAYFVKCDEDLNTPETRRAGKLICEVCYANKKPAEFVIFRFSHEVASN